MMCEVTFKDGYKCLLKLIYNWEKQHIYESPSCYLLVPYSDVVHSRVTVEEFQRMQDTAREQSRSEIKWKEIKPTSS